MNLNLIITPEDKPYLGHLKPLLESNSCKGAMPANADIVSKTQFTMGFDAVITTNSKFVSLFTPDDDAPSISNYAGSMFSHNGIPVLVLAPLKHLITVPYGKHLAARYLSKLFRPDKWYKPANPFDWTIVDPSNFHEVLADLSTARIAAVDIETTKQSGIYCISFCTLKKSYVLPIRCMEDVVMMRQLCAAPCLKVFQNGKYDINYLMAYNAPVYGWIGDTATLMHCWYSELPKDLASINAYLLRDHVYWKDMAKSDDLYEKYHYNAKDTYATLHSFLGALQEIPAYVKTNYLMEFPQNYPALHCELTGIKRDMSRLEAVSSEVLAGIAKNQASLEAMTVKGINVNSHVQIKKLMSALGSKDIAAESSDEKSLNKFGNRHPINRRIADTILEIRGLRKLQSTYLAAGKEFKGRILYSLNPHATDTGRFASKEHHFWCGLQIQNIPRGIEVKSTLVADDGWVLAECDKEQAESRYTGYISGDVRLIDAVENSPDFHSANASAFFGVPFDKIYSVELQKILDKALRDLAKRVNHGANYNMGPAVLVDTMGETKVRQAQQLLGLPATMTLLQVAEYLLAAFHRTYPDIAGSYYKRVILDVTTTHKLVGATGWTRYCFGNPKTNKLDLNAYVAHCPQSLSAMNLNKAFLAVWLEVALPNAENFRMLAQIHDSIFFTFREGYEHLAEKVREIMERETRTTITSCTGKTYTFYVPAALKAGKDGKGAKYWSETE